jgi:3-phytase
VLPLPAASRLLVVGDAVLDRAPSTDGRRPDVGGVSGAYYDRRTNRLLAVSDDHGRPRLLEFAVEVAPAVRLRPRRAVVLQLPGNRTLDAEGIAPAPGGGLFVSSEGDPADAGEPAAGVYEYRRDGRFVRSLPLPRAVAGDGRGGGMRTNGSIEALSLSPSRTRLFAGVESSLRQDGRETGFDEGALVRFLVYDLERPAAAPREFAYRTDPMPRPDGFEEASGDGGVAEVLALSDTELLVLERIYVRERALVAPRAENTIRIYRTSLDPAAEITGRQSLGDEPPAAVLAKTLLLDLADVAPQLSTPLRALENFEAMAFGPPLPDGSPTLLLLSDDNFSSRQVTALLVLRWASTG